MADEAQGPGWWQASDGAWYPPEQHPDAATAVGPEPVPVAGSLPPIEPPPTFAAPPPYEPARALPPLEPSPLPSAAPRPRRTGLFVAIAIVVVALVAVVVVSADKDDSTSASSRSSSTDASASSDTSDSSDSSDSNGSTLSPDAPTGPTVEAAGAGISITLPEGWTGTSTEDGVDGVGDALFPDDPDLADSFQTRVAALPRLVLLFGVDADAARSHPDVVANFNAAEDPTVPSGMSLSTALQAEARGLDALGEVKDQSIVSFPDFDAGRIEYMAHNGQFAGVAYLYKQAGSFWVVTFIFHDIGAANVALADASAATFKAG